MEPLITAAVAADGEIIYSRCRHDYNVSKDRSAWIDGGRDYTRSSSGNHFITLKVIEGEWYELEADDFLNITDIE